MHKPFVFILLALVCASCVPPKVDLEGKKCDSAGACVEGFACVAGVCVHRGAAGTPCDGANLCDSGLACFAGTCVAPADGGCSLGQTRACGSAVGTCTQGIQTCGADGGWGACDGGVQPAAETCDGRDEDCDGVADNAGEDGGFVCALDADGGPCSTPCGSTGTRICKNDCSGYTCVAPAEICNGRDDDCIGGVDDGFACVQGSRDGGPCTTSCSGPGVMTCADDCTGYVCRGPAETCNGLDDDCDGVVDDGFACAQRADGGPCTTTCGTEGTRICMSDCSGFACTAPAETCNGVDDDCDGVPDNGFACALGSDAGTCTLGCGATGYFACNGTCSGPDNSRCIAPPERCNGLDDNCACVDGGGCIDEGLTEPGYALSFGGGSPEPDLAAGPDGGVLVYVDSSSAAGNVLVQRLGPDYAPSNSPFPAHASAAAQSSPHAVLTSNATLIGWMEAGGLQLESIGSQSLGAPVSPTAQVASWSMASRPGSDEVWLSWADPSGALFVSTFGDGRFGPALKIVPSGAASPSIAVSPTGTVAVAYRAANAVKLDELAPDGGLLATSTVDSPTTGTDAPSATWTSSGFLVAYANATTATVKTNLGGNSGTTFSNATAPHVVGSPDGAGLAFLSKRNLSDGGASWQVAVARLDATGVEPANAQVSVATPLPGAQPVVSYDGTGYLVGWSGGGTYVYQELICP